MKYKTKPIIVEARQFTLEAATEILNIEEWCDGLVIGARLLSPPERTLNIYNSKVYEHEEADIGGWVVRYGDHFEVVTNEDFKKLYEVVE